jgi:hypothetical protein
MYHLVLGLPDRSGHLDIDDDGVLEIDEVDGRMEEIRLAAIRRGPARGGIDRRDVFLLNRRRRAEGRVVERRKILRLGRHE